MKYKEECCIFKSFHTRNYHTFKFRFDHVPFIHKYKHFSYFRKPKTTQEKRITEGHIKEKVYLKKRRTPRNLVNAWDDITFSSINIKNWKHQSKRKKQWK